MNPQWNPTWPEYSEITENENRTQEIVAQAEKIANDLNTEEARHALEKVRISAIAWLRDLRIETATELAKAKAEIWDTLDNTIDYTTWDISQDELGNITREFSDLSQMQSNENTIESPEAWTFWWLMLWYIEDTNAAILSGWENEINSQIWWYLTAFWSENWTWGITANAAYYWASAVLSSETMSQSVSRLEQIKSSSWSIETKLFQLSQILYEVWKEAWAPNELEAAHNSATRTIIKRVIENESWNFAIGFNKATGYYTTESINSTSSELEIGTYLCSLNKSGNLSKDHLLQPNGPFSATELFVILERYKNWEFGWDDVKGLFGEYLENFDSNMQSVIVSTINSAPNPETISAVIESWLTSNTETVNTVLSHCELCSRIDEYSYEDIRAMSPEELQAYQNNENTQPFHDALIKKIEFHEKTQENITQVLTELLQQALWQDTIPEWIQDKLNETSLETFVYMQEYFDSHAWNSDGGICKIQLLELLLSNNSPLQDLVNHVRAQNNIIIDESLLNTTIDSLWELWFENRISQISVYISTLEWEIDKILAIPENERSDNQITLLLDFQEQVEDANRDLSSTKTIRDREIYAEEIRWFNREQIKELKRYMQEENLPWSVALSIVEGTEYDFKNPIYIDFFENNPEHIRSLRNDENLISFLQATNQSVQIHNIHPSLRWDFQVIREVADLSTSDINLIPESYFNVTSESEAYSRMIVLLKNSHASSKLILTKFYTSTQGEDRKHLVSAISRVLSSQELHRLSASKLDEIARNIPDAILWEDIQMKLPRFEAPNEERERVDYDQFDVLYLKFISGTQTISVEDKNDLHDFFDKYGTIEKNMQFINLMKQWHIEKRTLEAVVPYMTKIDIFKNTISTWILKYGVNFTELLPHAWHTDPTVIQLTLESSFTQYEHVDHGFWDTRMNLKQDQENSLIKASNILKITDAPSLYAAYEGLGKDTDLLGKLFWNKFDSEAQLVSIADNAGEIYTNKFTRDKLPIILNVIQEIGEKQKVERWVLENILNIQEVIQWNEGSQRILLARQYLEKTFPWEKHEESINALLERLKNGFNPEHILPLLSNILKESDIHETAEITTITQNFLSEVRDGILIDQASIWEKDFNIEEIWNIPKNLLLIWNQPETFQIGEVVNHGGQRRNLLLQDFMSKRNWELWYLTSISAYLEEYQINPESSFGKSIKDFLIAEQEAVIAHWMTIPPLIEKIVEQIDKFNNGDHRAFDGLTKDLNADFLAWNIDTSWMKEVSELLSERWISINTDGTINSPEENNSSKTWNTVPESAPIPNPEWSRNTNFSPVEERIGWSHEAPTLTSWDSTIPISQEEAKMLRTNPEAEKNLVNMYEFFKKLNLLWVWEYREELITAVWEVTINLEDDSLAEDELLRFGKKLLNLIQKIQEEENPDEPSTINTNITSLDSLNLELSKFSGSRELWWDDRSFNTYWDDRFEAWMRNYGIIWWITFHTGKVREMMKK